MKKKVNVAIEKWLSDSLLGRRKGIWEGYIRLADTKKEDPDYNKFVTLVDTYTWYVQASLAYPIERQKHKAWECYIYVPHETN